MNLRILVCLVALLPGMVSAQTDSTALRALSGVPADIKPETKADRLRAQRAAKMYHINKAIDYPVTLVVGLEAVYAMKVIYGKEPTTDKDLLALNRNNIPAFDRWATRYHDLNIDKKSYYPFYGAMPLPLLLLLDKNIARDKWAIGTMYLEAFAFEGFLYTGAGYLANRYRPDVYNTALDKGYREGGNNRNSFFAGHVAVVANGTFFLAKVYNDYHPRAGVRWVFYGGATAATLGMGYLRLAAGKHFPSDIVAGALVGTACGLLTPEIHKNRHRKPQRWTMTPDMNEKGATGFAFTYRL